MLKKKELLKVFLFLTFFINSYSNAISQDIDIKSVKQEYHKLRSQNQLQLEDSLILVNNLYHLIQYYFYEGDMKLYTNFENELQSVANNFNHPLLKLRILQIQDLHINEFNEAIKHCHKMIKAFNDAIAIDPTNQELLESKALTLRWTGVLYQKEYGFIQLVDSFYNEAIDFSLLHNLNMPLAVTYNSIAIYHEVLGNYNQAIKYYDSAIEYSKLLKDRTRELRYSMNKAIILSLNGDIRQSTDLYLDCLEKVKDIDLRSTEAKIYYNLHFNFKSVGDTTNAIEYLENAHDIYLELSDTLGISNYYLSIGEIQNQNKDYDNAIVSLERSLKLIESSNNYYEVASRYLSIGTIYLDNFSYEIASDYLNSVIELSENYMYTDLLIASKTQLAKLFNQQNKYGMANEVLFSISKLEDRMTPVDKELFRENLALSYEGLGNYELAYLNYKKFKTIHDTLLNVENIRDINTIESNFKHEQEKIVINLNHKAELHRNKLIQYGLGLGILFFVIATSFIYSLYRQKESLNKELIEKKTALENVNRTKDLLFSVLGHDLRKPTLSFRGITKKVNHLINNKDFVRLEKLGDSIEHNANELSNLTDNLLNWALTQKDALSINPESLNIELLLEEVAASLHSLINNKKLTINIDIPNNCRVKCDRNSLLIVVRNLLDNAIKFSHFESHIYFVARRIKDNIELKIIDQGSGMANTKLKSLFINDQQIITHLRYDKNGTGMGTRLVNELVKLNRWIIRAESKINSGTVITLVLPFSE